MEIPLTLRSRLVTLSEMGSYPAVENILGAIVYQKAGAEAEPWPLPREVPRIYVQMVRPQDESVAEIWYSSKAVSYESAGMATLAHDGEYMFAATGFTERDNHLEQQTESLYLEALRLLNRLAYTNICRIWNYVPAVNQTDKNGDERYKVFCAGRSKAFAQYFSQADIEFPAATGIGSMGGDVGVVFLCKKAGEVIHLENPAQTPAYFYPKHYGRRSPSFSRATYATSQGGQGYHIFVSGTSSVVGYDSVHHGNVARQVEVTIDNINKVVSRSNLSSYGINGGHSVGSLSSVKVYIRHEQDFSSIKTLCDRRFTNGPVAYLHADICRSDLDVEIEGVVYGEVRQTVLETLRDYFTWQTAHNARKPAYIYVDEEGREAEKISFLELRHKVLNIAACLQKRLKKGDKMVLAYSPGIDFIVAYYACILSGIVAIPILAEDQIRPAQFLQKIQLIADTLNEKFAVLCDGDTCRKVGEHSLQGVVLFTISDLWDKHQKSFEFIAIDRDDIATLLFTSGSSGRAQGVPLTHENLVDNAKTAIADWAYTDKSVSVSWLPHYHSSGLIFNIILPICSGNTAVLMAPGTFVRHPARWLRTISHYRATHSAAAAFDFDTCTAQLEEMQDIDLIRLVIGHDERRRI